MVPVMVLIDDRFSRKKPGRAKTQKKQHPRAWDSFNWQRPQKNAYGQHSSSLKALVAVVFMDNGAISSRQREVAKDFFRDNDWSGRR
jgi:hypothetical protein